MFHHHFGSDTIESSLYNYSKNWINFREIFGGLSHGTIRNNRLDLGVIFV